MGFGRYSWFRRRKQPRIWSLLADAMSPWYIAWWNSLPNDNVCSGCATHQTAKATRAKKHPIANKKFKYWRYIYVWKNFIPRANRYLFSSTYKLFFDPATHLYWSAFELREFCFSAFLSARFIRLDGHGNRLQSCGRRHLGRLSQMAKAHQNICSTGQEKNRNPWIFRGRGGWRYGFEYATRGRKILLLSILSACWSVVRWSVFRSNIWTRWT